MQYVYIRVRLRSVTLVLDFPRNHLVSHRKAVHGWRTLAHWVRLVTRLLMQLDLTLQTIARRVAVLPRFLVTPQLL